MEVTAAVSLLTFLLGLWGGHYFSLLRDKRKEYNDAADSMRKHLMAERAEVLHMFAAPSSFAVDQLLAMTPRRRRGRLRAAFEQYSAAKSNYGHTNTGGTFMNDLPEAEAALSGLIALVRRC